MPQFAYQTRDEYGRSDSGVVVAESADDASRTLRRKGKIVVGIQQQPSSTSMGLIGRPRRVRHDDIIFFANQLAVMVDTGVPLADALQSIHDQTDHDGMKAVLEDVCDQVKAGTEFSTALERHPKVFSRLFSSMMRASEASGTMGQMLVRVSQYMSDERDTRKRIQGAMIYPVCLLGFCLLVVVALLVFVLPRFEKIYAGKAAALPLPTRALLAMSSGFTTYWPVILGGVVALTGLLYLYARTSAGRIFMDRLRIDIPILGSMYRKAYLSRSLRTLGAMIAAGVSMLDALAITGRVAGNHFYATVWNDLADRVKEGSSLAEPLFQVKLIPRMVTQMISAGERTGRLSQVMNRVASFCEADLKVAVKTVTQMVEPLMIIIMGLIIGGIAIALLLPIFSISKLVAQ